MAVFETLFIMAGILIGLVSRGGMYLFLLPLAVVAFVLAMMNRPSPTGSSTKKNRKLDFVGSIPCRGNCLPAYFFPKRFQRTVRCPQKGTDSCIAGSK